MGNNRNKKSLVIKRSSYQKGYFAKRCCFTSCFKRKESLKLHFDGSSNTAWIEKPLQGDGAKMLVSDKMLIIFENKNFKMNCGVRPKTDGYSQTTSKYEADKKICQFCGKHLYGLKNALCERSEVEEKKSIAHGEIYYIGDKNGNNGDKKSAYHSVTIKMFCIFCNQYYDGPKKAECVREWLELSKTEKALTGGYSTLDIDRAKTVVDQTPFKDVSEYAPINADSLNKVSGTKGVTLFDASLGSDDKELIEEILLTGERTKSVSDEISSDGVEGDETKIELCGDLPFKKNKKLKLVTNGVLLESAPKNYEIGASGVPHKMDLENKVFPTGLKAKTEKINIASVGIPVMSCEKAKTFCYGVPPVAGFPPFH